MDARFRTMLPLELQEAVGRIEALAECEIIVRPDSGADEFDNLSLGIPNGQCEATIAFRGVDITRCALIHEVLHIRRYWLDSVPTLFPLEGYEAEVGILEGLVEHLVIIPEERQFAAAESDAHWTAVLDRAVRQTLWSDRVPLYVYRAMLDIALPHLDNKGVYRSLWEGGLLNPSDEFVRTLRPLISNKEKSLQYVREVFGYDPSMFRVAHADLKARPRRLVYHE